MYVLGGEEVADLVEHVLDKLIGLGIAATEDVAVHAPVVAHLVGTAGAAQFGIGGKCCQHVAGHVYLGDDGDIAVGSILHDVAHLLLGIEATIAHVVVYIGVASHGGTAAPCAHLGQTGIFLDFDVPSLVFGEMPVEAVHVVQRQHINILLDKVGREEVARAVEVHAAIGEAGCVVDDHGGQSHLFGLGQHGQTLAQGLYAVEDALGCGAADGDATG